MLKPKSTWMVSPITPEDRAGNGEGPETGRSCSVEILFIRGRLRFEHEVEGDLAEEAFALLGGG